MLRYTIIYISYFHYFLVYFQNIKQILKKIIINFFNVFVFIFLQDFKTIRKLYQILKPDINLKIHNKNVFHGKLNVQNKIRVQYVN